jgi:hypothetical protein
MSRRDFSCRWRGWCGLVRTCTLDLRFQSFGNVSLLDIYSESPVRISYDPFRGGSSVTLPSNWQLIVNVSHALALSRPHC